MTHLLVNWLLSALSLVIVAHVVSGFHISGLFGRADCGDRDRFCERNARLPPEDHYIAADDSHAGHLLAHYQRTDAETGRRVCAGFFGSTDSSRRFSAPVILSLVNMALRFMLGA